MFFKNAGKTVVKGGNFTLLNADWGAIIIGGSLKVGELLKSRGWWAPRLANSMCYFYIIVVNPIFFGSLFFVGPESLFFLHFSQIRYQLDRLSS